MNVRFSGHYGDRDAYALYVVELDGSEQQVTFASREEWFHTRAQHTFHISCWTKDEEACAAALTEEAMSACLHVCQNGGEMPAGFIRGQPIAKTYYGRPYAWGLAWGHS